MKKLSLLAILLLPMLVMAQPTISGFTYLTTYGGHYYYISNIQSSWGDLATACHTAGGYPASITSSGENAAVTALLVSDWDFWIGLYYTGTAWAWENGEPFIYNNWGLDFPTFPATNTVGVLSTFAPRGHWYNDVEYLLGNMIMEYVPVLPVEMTSFSATGADHQVALNWRTESETENSHFNIYRSTNREDRGDLVTRVAGHGTTANANNYRYVDANVVNGTTYYYHISDVALDGAEHMSNFVVSAVPALNATGEIPFKYSLVQNFPNPFNPTTTITYGIHKTGNVHLTVFNAMGKEVATLVDGIQTPNTYKVDFNAASLPSGVYYYKLQTEGFTTTKMMTLSK